MILFNLKIPWRMQSSTAAEKLWKIVNCILCPLQCRGIQQWHYQSILEYFAPFDLLIWFLYQTIREWPKYSTLIAFHKIYCGPYDVNYTTMLTTFNLKSLEYSWSHSTWLCYKTVLGSCNFWMLQTSVSSPLSVFALFVSFPFWKKSGAWAVTDQSTTVASPLLIASHLSSKLFVHQP